MKKIRPETGELAPRETDSALYTWFVGSSEDPTAVRTLYDYLYCCNRPPGDAGAFYWTYLPMAMWYFDYLEHADAQYASLIQSRKLGLLERGWKVEAARSGRSDNARAQEIADFARRCLEQLPNFEQDLFELLDAVSKGFAVSEIMWRLDGRRWIVDSLRSRPQQRVTFDAGGALRLRSHQGPGRSRAIPPGKFILHVHMPQHENPLGQPLALRAFWPHWFKKNAVKFWSVFMDRFGMPTATVTYRAGARGQKEEALNVLESYMSTTGVALPEGVRLELMDCARSASVNVYESFVNVMDSWMAKLVLGGTLTGGEGRHGTQALGGVHERIRRDIMFWDGRSLAATVRSQLLCWMTLYNFGPDAARRLTPEFQFETTEPPDRRAEVSIDAALVEQLGMALPKADVYRKYGWRIPADGEEIVGNFGESRVGR